MIKELVAGVRREGSWLAFRRAEQRASFRLWWLVARGRATTADPLDFDFSAASAFYGSRKGYVFKTGDQGLGYYLDDVEKAKERVLEGLEVLGRVAGLPNELRSKVLGFWCLAE